MEDAETVTLKMVYEEVRNIRRLLEELTERALVNVLPEEEISDEEWREINEIDAEIERGEHVALGEAKRRYRVK